MVDLNEIEHVSDCEDTALYYWVLQSKNFLVA